MSVLILRTIKRKMPKEIRSLPRAGYHGVQFRYLYLISSSSYQPHTPYTSRCVPLVRGCASLSKGHFRYAWLGGIYIPVLLRCAPKPSACSVLEQTLDSYFLSSGCAGFIQYLVPSAADARNIKNGNSKRKIDTNFPTTWSIIVTVT